ncbi:hypothetical protein ASPACDRAFT_46865 [Aspergillus aculeatus ATCC 16872]|uniref:Uncharacterized protein n=1 Tax=Aspergillus aculeatus (strain ATCC 16872 / CBS 172.66 / WB 5094) TaxID=690307 RepID=A0A1L9WKK3_ASPA1|nr:uncharacterized protein ASPACDRAFT_46865 [Aspergillus aculeatus ATCC 16872]OJJ96690.1 hypothetical protein ASPACDRAFT_46865 [Aspergillus aculeatus ATCC 16872]
MSTTVPPAYEPHSSPPSYDFLVDKVCQLVGPDPTRQKSIDAAATLSDSENKILKDGGDFSDPIKNEHDNKVFTTGAAKGLASPECAEHLQPSQIRTKERQKASLENQIEQIRLARQELMDAGDDKLEAFRVNLNVLQSVWTSVAADTRIISRYLDDALDNTDIPEWMQWELENANSIYKQMAEYLTNYANETPS